MRVIRWLAAPWKDSWETSVFRAGSVAGNGEPLFRLTFPLGPADLVDRLAAWRDDFLESGKQGLKQKRPRSEDDRRLSDAERKIGELTMENEILRRAAEKRGASDPAAKAAEIAMETDFPLSPVCAVLGASRSVVYYRRSRG